LGALGAGVVGTATGAGVVSAELVPGLPVLNWVLGWSVLVLEWVSVMKLVRFFLVVLEPVPVFVVGVRFGASVVGGVRT
jgi:hypothetical protein